MTMMAVAVVGSAAVGAYTSNRASKNAAKQADRGSKRAAEAATDTANTQVAEIARQFDYQQELLRPLVERQVVAGDAFQSLLGIGSGGPQQQGQTQQPKQPANQQQPGQDQAGFKRDNQISSLQQQRDSIINRMGASSAMPGNIGGGDRFQMEEQVRQLDDQISGLQSQPQPQQPGNQNYINQQPRQQTQFNRDASGAFVDSNLSDKKMLDRINQNSFAAPTMQQDARFQNVQGSRLANGAAGQGVYGDSFEASPGFEFATEQMNRQVDRKNSAGGNFGGRALMEATRRTQGLANQEYYNYAQGRERDLQRLGSAEAMDASRQDQAVNAYEGQRVSDIQRGDSAFGTDMQRQDQAYYNYLSNVSGMAGFGNATGQAVQSSQAAGGATTNAIGNQGAQLGSIYQNNAANQAQIGLGNAANINNAVQSGVGNWITYQGTQ